MKQKSHHSLCAWTFNAGKGGFTPADARPGWSGNVLSTEMKIQLIKKSIMPRLPEHVVLGMEMHYDYECNEANAASVADALCDAGIALAMVSPGAHQHFAYGGVASLDAKEMNEAKVFGSKALDVLYSSLKKAWCKDVPPTFVIWNGSFGYDLATMGIWQMYRNLKQSVAELCKYEQSLGGELFIAIEPKPNEGHPAMLLPTVASAIVFWKKLESEFGVSLNKKGVNKEFGHSEMIGLDHVYDTVEEIDNGMLMHMHINSQGYNDGLILGGPGKYDIDNGARINGMNIAIAGLIRQSSFVRWKGHDMQPRAYDNEEQAIDRVIRSILSWEACEIAAAELDEQALMNALKQRETARAEDIMRHLVEAAGAHFDRMYK